MDFNKVYESTQKLNEAFAGNYIRYVIGCEEWEKDDFFNSSFCSFEEDDIIGDDEKCQIEQEFAEYQENGEVDEDDEDDETDYHFHMNYF